MTDDTNVREFLERMANEIDVSPVDPRRPAERARRHRAAATAIVVVAVVAAIVSAGSLGLRSITGSRGLGPAGQPSPIVSTISAETFGFGGPGGFTVQTPPGWSSPDGRTVINGKPGVLGISVWQVQRVPRNPCSWKGTLHDPGPTVDDLVRALEEMPIRTASAPTDVTLDGFHGRFLTWTVPADLVVTGNADFAGCDHPGNGHRDLVSWLSNMQGEQYAQVAGQVDLLWVLDVRGHRLVVDAAYGPGTPQADQDELSRVVQSLHFWTTG